VNRIQIQNPTYTGYIIEKGSMELSESSFDSIIRVPVWSTRAREIFLAFHPYHALAPFEQIHNKAYNEFHFCAEIMRGIIAELVIL